MDVDEEGSEAENADSDGGADVNQFKNNTLRGTQHHS
jgi:hypothetical protein